ncbi:TPA: phospholipase D family protein [Serratia fonticola]
MIGIKKLSAVVFLAVAFHVNASTIEVGFSPGGSALPLIIETIKKADKEILVAAYSFTSKPIALALVEAQKNGVSVKVVADAKANQDQYTAVTYLKNHAVPVRLSRQYAIMHNKFIVIDGKTVQSGSFNYTSSAAKRNAENVLVVRDAPDVAAAYRSEFLRLWGESVSDERVQN